MNINQYIIKIIHKIHLVNLFRIRSDRNSVQFRSWLLIMILVLCGTASWLIKANAVHNADHNADIQKGIAEDIIRFHVIANSDSDEDQTLKIEVKNKLVQSLSPVLSNTSSITEARSILLENIDFIRTTAETYIKNEGYHYPVQVTLENCYFPLKLYGNYSFPPGIYEALRVRIGKAEGKNWWCVMFPPLCFVDETYSVVDKKTNTKLKHLLTEEEYKSLVKEKKPIKIKFKIWEKIKKLFH